MIYGNLMEHITVMEKMLTIHLFVQEMEIALMIMYVIATLAGQGVIVVK
jgi:hypothetical protein